jgi:hypothetical protein
VMVTSVPWQLHTRRRARARTTGSASPGEADEQRQTAARG